MLSYCAVFSRSRAGVFVSPDGSDSNNGTRSKLLKRFRAIEAAPGIKKKRCDYCTAQGM